MVDFKANTFRLIICIFSKNRHWCNSWDSLLLIRNKLYIIICKISVVFEVKSNCDMWRKEVISLKPCLKGQLVQVCDLVNIKQLELESNPVSVYVFQCKRFGNSDA